MMKMIALDKLEPNEETNKETNKETNEETNEETNGHQPFLSS